MSNNEDKGGTKGERLEVFQKLPEVKEEPQESSSSTKDQTKPKKKPQPFLTEHLPSPRHMAMREAVMEQLSESRPSYADALSMSGPKPKYPGFPSKDLSVTHILPPVEELPQGELPQPPARDTQPELPPGAGVLKQDKRRRRRGRRSHKVEVALPEVAKGIEPILEMKEKEVILIDSGQIHLPEVETEPKVKLQDWEKDLLETVERKAPDLLALPLPKLETIALKGVGEDRGKEKKKLPKKSRMRRKKKEQQQQGTTTTPLTQH